MSFRWSAFVGVAFAFFPTTGVIAEMHGIPLSDTIYVKWSGALDQATLADTSILNEYVAQTYSENVNGASIQLAFVPRFNCSPVFSVRLSAAAAAAPHRELRSLGAGFRWDPLSLPQFVVMFSERTCSRP